MARAFHSRVHTLLLLGLLTLLLLGSGCEPHGDSTISPPQSVPGATVEQQVIESLVQLYGEAVRAENIDRLQAMLAPPTVSHLRQSRGLEIA